jgi:Patatin-like phospholipase
MAQVFPNDLSREQIDRLFPLRRDPIKKGSFEIGLVLGGTVSAGAYTAGVLDYLIEACDAWTRAKDDCDREMPTHEVIISTIGGASGGAIYGAAFMRAALFGFEHGMSDANPFYRLAQGVDLIDLLSTRPEDGVTGLASLLNCSAIDQQSSRSKDYVGDPLGPMHRRYLADPLRLLIMIGNLRGIPYSIGLSGESKLAHNLIAHADFMRFALHVEGGAPNVPKCREDEVSLDSSEHWEQLRAAALASSAFPVLLRSRSLQRMLSACGYRVTVVSGQATQLIPKWAAICADEPDPGIVNFGAIDGGAFNNQPLDMVRTELAGLEGRNQRCGISADRAVILIDPFSDHVPLGPQRAPGLVGVLWPFLNSLVYQARFKPEDIALAEEPNVYSRFLVAPFGTGSGEKSIAGSGALASGGLSGFLGFVDHSFRRYDYQLGRRNAYEFLRRDFVFPEGNQAFVGHWTHTQIETQRVTSGPWQIPLRNGHLPMIPLVKRLRENPPPPMTKECWPRLQGMPTGLSSAIEGRLQAVYDLLMDEYGPAQCYKRLAASLGFGIPWRLFLRSALRDRALDAIRNALKAKNLIETP